jgi:hypothetical protein
MRATGMTIAKRDYRSSWRHSAYMEWHRHSDYEITAVYLWSIVGVILATFLAWLAFGA